MSPKRTSAVQKLAAFVLIVNVRYAWEEQSLGPPNTEISAMKTTLFVLCLFCAAGAFAQGGIQGSVLSNEVSIFHMPSHVEHASRQSVTQGQSLLEASGSSYARGEKPLWEVAPQTAVVPLGDTARALRKQHAETKKATIVWNN